ncbi:MAG: tRNA epoxyqueuosine(34) reductase QueG [Planctomycetota bacterium]
MTADAHQRAEDVIKRCVDLGFANAGIAPVHPSDYADEFHAWLDKGKHGPMSWLAEHAEVRTDPAALLDGARSIIMVADQYATRNDPPDAPAPGVGRIARYARGDDYHKVIKKRLHTLADALREAYPDHAFRACVDTAPLMEREHAARAGLGWVGKHTLLIDPLRGSYLLLGALLTTLELEPPATQRAIPDHCGTCTRCIDACPTDAITPYSVDARRCIATLTIEQRTPIDPAFHEPIGDWIFGCDICQQVCPHNSPRTDPVDVGDINPAYAPRRTGFDLLDVLAWQEHDRRDAFTTSAMKRATLAMMRRNAVIAAGNVLRTQDLPALRARVEAIAGDEHEDGLVRHAARVVTSSRR